MIQKRKTDRIIYSIKKTKGVIKMARTESLSIQVHPNDEQSQINLMQRFYWELLSSQEIKTSIPPKFITSIILTDM